MEAAKCPLIDKSINKMCYVHTTKYIIRPVVRITEKAMAPHSSTLAWEIPWMEEPGRLQSMGSRRVVHNWATSLSLSCTREGNGNPLQYSCLENPRDGGAWWAAVYGVAQSQTRLTWLSSSSSNSRNYILIHATIWVNFEDIILSEISQSQKDK